jgi:hypothetical protein
MSDQQPEADHLIWSMEHNAWWCADHCGYSTSILLAGLYTKAAADEVVAGSRGRNERAVPIDSVYLDIRNAVLRAREVLEAGQRLLAVATR